MAFTRVCSLAEIQPGTAHKVDPNGLPLMLLNDAGTIHASSRVCIHRGGDLSQGLIDSSVVMCPLHFWKFDLKTGACLQVPQMALKTYPVKTENDEVMIDV